MKLRSFVIVIVVGTLLAAAQAPAKPEAAAPPKSPQQPKAAPKPKRPTYHRYRAPRRIGIPPPKPPPEDPWPFIIIVAAVIVFLILSDAWERSRPLRFPIPNSGHVTHRK